MKKVGILGGTFDPPHLGHLFIAQEVQYKLELDEVWFIPAYEAPHKRKSRTDAVLRLEMVEAAIAENPYFRMESIEVDRLGKSYTFDTMELLQEMHPDTAFHFIIGADLVESLHTWHRIDDLVDKLTFVGVGRPGYELMTTYPVTYVDIPELEISSSMIRERVKQGAPVHYLVSGAVFDIIKEQKLYAER
ncbi:nicotinate-nucleotide adenylyltransferase [Terribacillus halophilus]|uniref:Probable nicotinate-nucleotide adenylyltransferase n=1 Tax=Terribacillus halophilus TaxID=361279 RepID=A0A1G6SNV8_9BACI|nr:nicotinate-nucleotide adenylyltransferase [Terribacillus halophilus]SDD18294.1 nicotinate-nucleotide adenylyltransferase [Terribacillus halophilus]